MFKIALLLLLLGCMSRVAAGADERPEARDEPAKPTGRAGRTVEGWTVRVDDRLLRPPNEEEGDRALKLLEANLANIRSVVAPDRLAKLRAVPIVLDLTHGGLKSMQYHPSADWLKENGYSTELARCVHIPVAAEFTDARNNNEQPWAVLHELSHAYHDQVLGFDEARVREVYEHYKASGRGESVLHIGGRRQRHYALTDQKEFFAEMSEAYFGANDFFPFNRAELRESEPEIYRLMRDVWGPVAQKEEVRKDAAHKDGAYKDRAAHAG